MRYFIAYIKLSSFYNTNLCIIIISMKSGRSITAPEHQLSHRYMPTTPDKGATLPAHQSSTGHNEARPKGNPNRSSGSIP